MSSNVRRLNNLEDRRLCSNNICISISAMDALLWHVAVMKECEFMLGSAISDKSEFEHQIAILKEKIDAIQPRLDDIAGKR